MHTNGSNESHGISHGYAMNQLSKPSSNTVDNNESATLPPPAYTSSAQPLPNGTSSSSHVAAEYKSNGQTNGHARTGYHARGVESLEDDILDLKPDDLSKNLRTDRRRWRLVDEDGRQTWKYLRTREELEKWPQGEPDMYSLGLDINAPDLPPAHTPLASAHNALSYFEHLQMPSGHWGCEYGGPMFLLPGLVITWYVTETPIPAEYRIEITNYLFARQHKEDFGWGLHIEGISSVFGTALNYVVLRILGVKPDDERMVKARATLHKMGGAVNGPHWTKFWLSVLGVYQWEGVNPVPPELWLLPDWVPIAPWRWWIHMRQVFVPMSYIYSRKFQYPLNELTRSLRDELYTQSYTSITFSTHRNSISQYDNYHPKSFLLNSINWALVNIWNPYLRPTSLATRAEAWVLDLIAREDENTDYACLGPVNGPMNTLATYISAGADANAAQTYAVRRHIDRLRDFLWVSAEGMLMNGTNGAQTWDTEFLILSCVEAGFATQERWRPMLTRALEFLDRHQIRENCREQEICYRQQRKGAWAFSTRDQGYTVSDCTAEGVKSVMALQALPGYPKLVSDERIRDAIDVLLTMQNDTGGFGTYEPRRGNANLMERLNAAEVFGRIMVEYDYPECTTAVVSALIAFKKQHPDYRTAEINKTLDAAVAWIRHDQREDGSWYGSWGICFTYAGMFALNSLALVGETYTTSARVRRACQFFLEKQREDGGWGESYKSCEDGVWREHPQGSQVVNTSWAVIALLEAGYPEKEPLRRAVRLLMQRQRANGEWLQEGIEGVFNKSCMISYPNYKFVFPIKALGMYAHRWGDEQIL